MQRPRLAVAQQPLDRGRRHITQLPVAGRGAQGQITVVLDVVEDGKEDAARCAPSANDPVNHVDPTGQDWVWPWDPSAERSWWPGNWAVAEAIADGIGPENVLSWGGNVTNGWFTNWFNNFGSGWGDVVSFGITLGFRRLLGYDTVDQRSNWTRVGQTCGFFNL